MGDQQNVFNSIIEVDNINSHVDFMAMHYHATNYNKSVYENIICNDKVNIGILTHDLRTLVVCIMVQISSIDDL